MCFEKICGNDVLQIYIFLHLPLYSHLYALNCLYCISVSALEVTVKIRLEFMAIMCS